MRLRFHVSVRTFIQSIQAVLLIIFLGSVAFSQEVVMQDPGKLVEIKLYDGIIIVGEVVSENSEIIIVKSASLGELTIKKSDIRKLTEIKPSQIKEGKYWFKNPNSTRYLFGPTGRNLKKGEGYYQNILVTTNLAHYGITDWFSIGGGFEGISTFAGEPIFFILPKFGFEITEKFSVGAGYVYANAATLIDDDGGFAGVGFGYGTATYGTSDDHATFGIGWGQASGEFTDAPIFTISGMTRVSRRIGLVTENWLIPTDPYYWVSSYGIKIIGERSSFDIALINSKDIATVFPVGLPVWFSYNFYF